MRHYYILVLAVVLFCCKNNSKTADNSATADTVKSAIAKQVVKDTTFELGEATALPKKIDTIAKSAVPKVEMKPAYLVNQRDNTTLLYWWYDGGSYQNMNCPVGKNCFRDDGDLCRTNHEYTLIGNVPCGVTIQVHCVFKEPNGSQVVRNIPNSNTACSYPGVAFMLRK